MRVLVTEISNVSASRIGNLDDPSMRPSNREPSSLKIGDGQTANDPISANSLQSGVAIVNGNSRECLQVPTAEQSLSDGLTNRASELPFIFPAADLRGGTAADTAPAESQRDIDATTADVVSTQIAGWKRLLDHTCIWLTSPLWLAVMVMVGTWILLVSPGPLFYRQERVGYRGRRFLILKFRTMNVNVETQSHEGYFERLIQADCPMTKLDVSGDRRLIRGGRILRALGLDELPQIFNVVRGEMSLVGPRPCTPHEFERYLPGQKQRVNAPPGITGYWQVNGKNRTTFSEMIAMDIFYGKNMSIQMDLVIMLRTVPAIATQVLEALSRKTGAKVGPILKDWPFVRLRCWASRIGRRVR
jgi:lipopolysaccharide/colanic/teichoic acid biosynthesis glycosyltransferase